MSIRVTITKPNVFNVYGIAMVVGQTYTVDDDFGRSLITQLKASDTDGSLVNPGVGLGVAPDLVYVNAATIAAPTAQMRVRMLRSFLGYLDTTAFVDRALKVSCDEHSSW